MEIFNWRGGKKGEGSFQSPNLGGGGEVERGKIGKVVVGRTLSPVELPVGVKRVLPIGVLVATLSSPLWAPFPPPPPPFYQPAQIGTNWVQNLKIEGSIDFKRGVPGGSYQVDSWRLEKLPRPGLYLLRLYLVKKLGKFTDAVTKRRLILKVKGSKFAIYDPLSGKVFLYQWKGVLKAKPVKGGWEYQWEVPPIDVEFSNPDGSYHLKFELLQ